MKNKDVQPREPATETTQVYLVTRTVNFVVTRTVNQQDASRRLQDVLI